jgi:hypothetical protein
MIINVCLSSYKVPLIYSCKISMKIEFSRQSFETKWLKCKISWKSVQWESQCSMRTDGRTDRQTDRQTNRQRDMRNVMIAFRSFANAPENTLEEVNVQVIWLHAVNKIEHEKSCTSTTIHAVKFFFFKNCYISVQDVIFVVCPRKIDSFNNVRIGDKFLVINCYLEGQLACSIVELCFVSWNNLG